MFHETEQRKTDFFGVRCTKGHRWQAVARIGKGQRNIVGVFSSAEEAARAHDSAAFYLHGRWAMRVLKEEIFLHEAHNT